MLRHKDMSKDVERRENPRNNLNGSASCMQLGSLGQATTSDKDTSIHRLVLHDFLDLIHDLNANRALSGPTVNQQFFAFSSLHCEAAANLVLFLLADQFVAA